MSQNKYQRLWDIHQIERENMRPLGGIFVVQTLSPCEIGFGVLLPCISFGVGLVIIGSQVI